MYETLQHRESILAGGAKLLLRNNVISGKVYSTPAQFMILESLSVLNISTKLAQPTIASNRIVRYGSIITKQTGCINTPSQSLTEG